MEFARRQTPYWSARTAVPTIMLQVLAALVPAAIAHIWFFGPGFIFNLLVAFIFAIGGEYFVMRLRKRPRRRRK